MGWLWLWIHWWLFNFSYIFVMWLWPFWLFLFFPFLYAMPYWPPYELLRLAGLPREWGGHWSKCWTFRSLSIYPTIPSAENCWSNVSENKYIKHINNIFQYYPCIHHKTVILSNIVKRVGECDTRYKANCGIWIIFTIMKMRV